MFDFPADIVDAILDTVDAETPEDVAVVLDSASRYSPLIESALETADVPFFGGPGFTERPKLRSFVACCRTAFRGDGATVEVTTSAGVDSVTVQTIHSAKGLEYPIVVLANMNEGKFPPRGGGSGVVRYEEPLGLRQRKVYADVEAHPHVYDNWTHDVLRHCVPDGYDEECRLLYVAITRAESHVVFAGGDRPNTFFEELPFEERSIDPTVESVKRGETAQTQLPFSVVPPDGPRSKRPTR